MPQLMPIFWINFVFMVGMLLLVLVFLYFYTNKGMEGYFKMILGDLVKSVSLRW